MKVNERIPLTVYISDVCYRESNHSQQVNLCSVEALGGKGRKKGTKVNVKLGKNLWLWGRRGDINCKARGLKPVASRNRTFLPHKTTFNSR
jgi:hypothetical protein